MLEEDKRKVEEDKVWTVDGVICLRPTQHTSTIERFTTMAKCREIVRKYSPS